MKLWEIKAQALRLMFADTDIDFSYTEFQNNSVYENANTREKLVRMNDSIQRAIDLYYFYTGTQSSIYEASLYDTGVAPAHAYQNYISTSDCSTMDYPSRIDLSIYRINSDGTQTLLAKNLNINFFFDPLQERISFPNDDFTVYYEEPVSYNLVFSVWHKVKQDVLALDTRDELTYEIPLTCVPDAVQRMIAYYVKGELYEEDEPSLAQGARQTYIQFLMGLKRRFSRVQTKVTHARVFDKE